MSIMRKALVFAIGLTWTLSAIAQEGDGALLQRSDFLKVLDGGKRLLDSGDAREACPQFYYILTNGSDLETYYRVAEIELARCLLAEDLPLSAYLYLSRVIDAGRAHPGFQQALPLLLDLAARLEGDISLLERLASYEEKEIPVQERDQVHYLTGKFLYHQNDLEGAAARFDKITTEDEHFYLPARFYNAVILVRQQRPSDALNAFKDILRYRDSTGIRSRFAEKIYRRAYLNMARLFYSVGDFETAVRYYNEIDKKDPLWLQSLFESSWAFFRMENYSKAMGNLWTLSSPYFEDEFYPEAFLIEANILYNNCHFDEALAIVNKFHEQYYKIYTELKKQLEKYDDPNEFYFYLARLSKQGGNMSLELKRIFNAAFMNKNLKRLLSVVVYISTEMRRLADYTRNPLWNELAAELKIEVDSYRDLIVGEAGDLSKTRLREVYGEIKGLLAKGIKLKIEAINARKKVTREALSAEAALDPAELTESGDAFWPFNGEYWLDELDGYYFVIESNCPERSAD